MPLSVWHVPASIAPAHAASSHLLQGQPNSRRRAPLDRKNAAVCSMFCGHPGSSTWPPPRSMPPCWTRASIIARSAPWYRILAENGEVRERRDQLRHPVYQKPELLAEAPNQVWSWDITKLMGPAKWSYFYLYVILDIFSRRVVGWCVADAENTVLFKELFHETFTKHDVPPGQLTLHADRGGPMKAKATAFLLADLGVTKSHSRPHTSNDNPFSEAHFKTLKYQPQFPKRFGCIEDARTFCRHFFTWYNQDHHHVGIGLMTPDQVHYGQAKAVHTARQHILAQAYQANPERFVRKTPVPPPMPNQTWINPPRTTKINQA